MSTKPLETNILKELHLARLERQRSSSDAKVAEENNEETLEPKPRVEERVETATSNSNAEIDPDFECPLCFRLFYSPISLSCGHTFCRLCLHRSLMYQQQCPLCRMPCTSSSSNQQTNLALRKVIEKQYPEEYAERAQEDEPEIERIRTTLRLPLFFLTEILFPGVKLDLIVFEPRYQILVSRCMEGNRQFGVQCDAQAQLGTIAEIRNIRRLAQGHTLIQVVGCSRYRVAEAPIAEEQAHGLHHAIVNIFDDEEQASRDSDSSLHNTHQELRTMLQFHLHKLSPSQMRMLESRLFIFASIFFEGFSL